MLTLATLMWAGHTIAARLSVGEMSPMVMMGLRWFACLAILMLIFRKQIRAEWPRVRERLGWVALMGGLGMAGFHFFFPRRAIHDRSQSRDYPEFHPGALVMVMSLLVFGTRIGLDAACRARRVLRWCSGPRHKGLDVLFELTFNPGDLLMLLACVCYAGYTVGLSRRIDMPPAIDAEFLFRAGIAGLCPVDGV